MFPSQTRLVSHKFLDMTIQLQTRDPTDPILEVDLQKAD